MERILSKEMLTAFQEYLICEEKSTATVEKYLRDVRKFSAYATGRAVTKDLVRNYKQYLQEQGYAVRSINSMLASITALLNYLGWGECRVKFLKQQKQIYCSEDKEITRAEYLRLLAAAERDTRLYLVMQTICGTGIRVSELRYFTVESVQRGEINVSCKGKLRTILIPGKLKRRLLAYARKEKISFGVIFRSRSGKPLNRSYIWEQMKRLCRQAKVAPGKVFPHNLRKLFARTFYAVEKDIAKLADILGHSSIDTTRIYIISTGTEHRRKIESLNLVL